MCVAPVFLWRLQRPGSFLTNCNLPAGRYLQMMDVLRPIAPEIFKCTTQVVDMFIFAVYKFFVEDYVRARVGCSRRDPGGNSHPACCLNGGDYPFFADAIWPLQPVARRKQPH